MVTNSIAQGNTLQGLFLGTGYRSNTLVNNNGGNINPQVAGGGFELGTNVCGFNTVCP